MHNVGVLKRLKRVELTWELAQRPARNQLKSDQKNSSTRRHAGCGKLLGHPLGPLLCLSHNKVWLNDQINCFVINACIFLFSTMIQTACLFCLYIFGLNNNISDCFYCIRVTIKCCMKIQYIVFTVLLIFYEDTIYLNYSSASEKTCIVSV